jgi:hypothetical protein
MSNGSRRGWIVFWGEVMGEKEGESLNNARWNFCPGRGRVTWSAVCAYWPDVVSTWQHFNTALLASSDYQDY